MAIDLSQAFLNQSNNAGTDVYVDNVLVTEPTQVDDNVPVEWRCRSGYQFTASNALYFYHFRFEYVYASINPELTVATIDTDKNITSVATFGISTEVAQVESWFTITQTLLNQADNSHVDIYVDDVEITEPYEVPSTDTIEFRARTGYEFYNQSVWFYVARREEYYYATVSGDGATATFKPTQNIAYTMSQVSTQAVALPVWFTITQPFLTEAENNNVTVWIDNVEIDEPRDVNPNEVIEFRADEGYLFYENSVWIRDNRNENYYYAVNAEDDLTATIEVTQKINTPSFQIRTLVDESEGDVAGTNNVYLVDDEQIIEFNKGRFLTMADNVTVYDYSAFIINLMRIPFDLPEGVMLPSERITLGSFQSLVTADKVSVDRLSYDLGTIEVPMPDNALGYDGVVAKIHIPFCEPQDVDLDYVYGHTVRVEFHVNVYDGLATVNVFSSKVNDVWFTTTVQVGVNIPMGNETTDPVVFGNTNIELGSGEVIRRPFIEIVEQEKPTADSAFQAVVPVAQSLYGHQGYVEVQNIALGSEINASDQAQIVSMLQDGVIIL